MERVVKRLMERVYENMKQSRIAKEVNARYGIRKDG